VEIFINVNILGIVPVAGEGSRWGGYFKELLPCGNREWLLDRTIKSMKCGGAQKICVITSISKITTHISHIGEKNEGIFYVIQRGKNDIWSAIAESLPFAEDLNLFAMPDTYFPILTFDRSFVIHKNGKLVDFHIGTLETKNPERFGVIIDGKIVNKSKDLPRGRIYSAWGTLVWTRKVAEFWLENSPQSYTDAINSAMDKFNWKSYRMEYYYDMAEWKDYRRFIEDREHGKGCFNPLYSR